MKQNSLLWKITNQTICDAHMYTCHLHDGW